MADALSQIYRFNGASGGAALDVLPPDSPRVGLMLTDWCARHAHTVIGSLPLFPLVGETSVAPDLRVSNLLLAENGALVATLIETDPSPSAAPLLGQLMAVSHWCATRSYSDLEELFNSDREEPTPLVEALRAHFNQSRICPQLASAINKHHVVVLMLPADRAPISTSLLQYATSHSIPVACVQYQCFEMGDDGLLAVSPLVQVETPGGGPPPAASVDITVVGDVNAMLTAISEPENHAAPSSEGGPSQP